jgi:fatty acid desaturase
MMVQSIEDDLGLSDPGNIEKRVLKSIIESYDQNGVASAAEILAHPQIQRPSLIAEWPTFAALLGCYGGWIALLFGPLWLSVPGLAVMIALQSSLQHEIIHGHPTRYPWLNVALVFASLNLLIPYGRFHDTHLAHHTDEWLTDPYDDPESNYLDPAVWNALPTWLQRVHVLNATLAGRLLIGVLISQYYFMRSDLRDICAGRKDVLRDWLLHIPAAALVIWIVIATGYPLWAYFLAAYGGLALLKIRTFAEHRAHEDVQARTAVIEDRGFFAFLFLNNNFHSVHHMYPHISWYALPGFYQAQKGKFMLGNQGYIYKGYRQLFARHFFHCKEPVPHPLWPSTGDSPKS